MLGGSQYVTEIQYNSRRQPVCYRYDSYSPIMQTRLTYRDWSDLRLHGITTGLPGATACQAPTGTALQHIEYGYDAAGNVTTITDYHNSSQVQSFGYDELDRLTSASTDQSGVGVYGESYEYYDNGNLKRKGPAAAGTYSYGDPAHRHAVTGLSGGGSFSYDANGNMLTRHVGGVLYTLTWDHENRLSGASWPGGSATFVYDHNGERTAAGTLVGGAVILGLTAQPHIGVPAGVLLDVGVPAGVSIAWGLYVQPARYKTREVELLALRRSPTR